MSVFLKERKKEGNYDLYFNYCTCCMDQQSIIDSLKKSKNSYDVRSALETAEMLFEDNHADLEKYIEVYNKFKKL